MSASCQPLGEAMEQEARLDELQADGDGFGPLSAEASLRASPQQVFFVMGEIPCPYLPGRWERKLITELHGRDAAPLYGKLSRAGFRRSHHFAYRPACSGCRACVPVRVRALTYRPSRSLRRIARINDDLIATARPPTATQEQFAVALGISVHTLRNWEQGRRSPEGPALALLRIAARHPRVLRENLAASA